jgi:hypothetical protein
MNLQHKFQNMFQHYDSHQFELCWQAFEQRNPGNPFPKDYAQYLWKQEWFGDLETVNWIITWQDEVSGEWTGGVEFEGSLDQAQQWTLDQGFITRKYKIEVAAE